MRGKISRKLRKIMDLNSSNIYDTEDRVVGSKQVPVIDGVDGNHRIEEREITVRLSNDNRRIYRKLKKLYTNANNEGYSELASDLKKN